MAATKPDRYQLFISHKVPEDTALAKTIKDKLTILSNGQLDIHVSELIPGGEDWYKWIEERIYQSSILVFLFTRDKPVWEWCIYEAGMFRGGKRTRTKKHLICIKNFEISKPPSPLGYLQAYNSDPQGIDAFLKDLLFRGHFTDKKKLNPQLLDDLESEFKSAVSDISERFVPPKISVEYVPLRMCIGPLSLAEDGSTRVLDGTPVSANKRTMGFLGFEENACIKWENLKDLFQTNQPSWTDDIQKAVDMVRTQKKPNQLLCKIFVPEKGWYHPVLSRIEKIQNDPVNLYVIFIKAENKDKRKSRGSFVEKEPENHRIILRLLEMARIFRWDILENSLQNLQGTLSDENTTRAVARELKSVLLSLEKQGESENVRNPVFVKSYFDSDQQNILEDSYNRYWETKERLDDAVDKEDKDQMVSILKDWRELNKQFMLMIIKRYEELIAML
jgi:hypothetical protein